MAKICDEAKRIAYEAGISALAPVAQRIIDLEEQVSVLTARVQALEQSGQVSALTARVEALEQASAPAHLRHVEKRSA
jgi:hypothetical protein